MTLLIRFECWVLRAPAVYGESDSKPYGLSPKKKLKPLTKVTSGDMDLVNPPPSVKILAKTRGGYWGSRSGENPK